MAAESDAQHERRDNRERTPCHNERLPFLSGLYVLPHTCILHEILRIHRCLPLQAKIRCSARRSSGAGVRRSRDSVVRSYASSKWKQVDGIGLVCNSGVTRAIWLSDSLSRSK